MTLRLSPDFIQALPLSAHFLEVLRNYINYAKLIPTSVIKGTVSLIYVNGSWPGLVGLKKKRPFIQISHPPVSKSEATAELCHKPSSTFSRTLIRMHEGYCSGCQESQLP